MTSKASMDPNFELRARDLRDAAKDSGAQLPKGEQVKWFRPADWRGDPNRPEDIAPAFASDSSNAAYIAAVTDTADPGTSGDIIVAALMAENLALIERAQNIRFLRRPRATCHVSGRHRAHGDDSGVFMNGHVEHIRSSLEQGKST